MNGRLTFRRNLLAVLFALSAVTCLILAFSGAGQGDASKAASRLERRLERRLAVLEAHASGNRQSALPEDMVIYRYMRDSLCSWSHQFPVSDDGINERFIIQRLSNPRRNLRSPLAEVPDSFSFMNLGYKWYLVKSVTKGEGTVIEGLELVDLRDSRLANNTNPRLRIGERFSLVPLSDSAGEIVQVEGHPCFKLQYALASTSSTQAGRFLLWLALGLLCAAAFCWLSVNLNLRSYVIFSLVVLVALASMYFYGKTLPGDSPVFSPLLFAGGRLLYSLGAVVLINAAILFLSAGIYMVRSSLRPLFRRGRIVSAVLLLVFLFAVALIAAYTHISVRSIIFNSGISLELYKLGDLRIYTALTYLSYISMLASVPMLLQCVRPAMHVLTGWSINVFSVPARLAFAFVVALYFTLVAMSYGFSREKERVEVWANRLAMERDIRLEMQLKRVEARIADDKLIAALTQFEGTSDIVRNRIAEGYLPRISPEYEIKVSVISGDAGDDAAYQHLRNVLAGGTPIFESSRFLYTTGGGRVSYEGVFPYYRSDGVSFVLMEVEPVSHRRDKGYSAIFSSSGSGLQIPSFYSYAKYEGQDMVYYKGSYAFPTHLNDSLFGDPRDGYVHFVNTIPGTGDTIVISRPRLGWFNYVVCVLMLAVVTFVLLSPFPSRHRRGRFMHREYFRTRISGVIMYSLLVTLVTMTAVSVAFVYRRNEINLQTLLSEKTGNLQLMVQDALNAAGGADAGQGASVLRSPEFRSALESIASSSGTDLTLYAPDGRLLVSTAPEVFDQMLLGCRMDETAFDVIVNRNRRYYAQKENLSGRQYYAMYAPLFNSEGKIVAVMSSPYTERSYDFEREAIMHLIAVLAVFAILLILAMLTVSRVVGRMFHPLVEMGRKMNEAGEAAPEYIEYDKDDELSSLFRAYNGMVTQLSESSVALAKAERDKAWSGMARQVAHEIKNPLTPMKLQLQRMVRLKQKGDPAWQEKFDEMTGVLLEHIEILTETANEFSDFAKLYTQEPVKIDLNKLLEEEISMFDGGKKGVSFNYFGLEGATINGPKPQLTRVFDNIINNSVQALEGMEDGQINVSLRKSGQDGFYDIVFEDNGPGVSEENQDKLFTPNFTTKTGGTGLGLAISRSVLERCGATISYSRSFALGGACFTICFPA
ncbi:MAG: cache domain-containing protein [Bacteroidales bacterium]|nr:cache domain-containing protein [Bacteroidales bacterium]